MLRCQVTGPKVEHYFSLIGYKCNLHFWHAQNECPFAVHTCIDRQFERSRVLRETNFLVLIQVYTSFVVNLNIF